MWWRFTKKIQRHRDINENEIVLHACYGLGAKLVQFANRTVSPVTETWSVPQSREGLALPINCNGVLALTDRRLCFFPKIFAFGTPKTLKFEWGLNFIENISYSDGQMRVDFSDGSRAELHVPRSQSPSKLVTAFSSLPDRAD
jgi:hypothetical protein